MENMRSVKCNKSIILVSRIDVAIMMSCCMFVENKMWNDETTHHITFRENQNIWGLVLNNLDSRTATGDNMDLKSVSDL